MRPVSAVKPQYGPTLPQLVATLPRAGRAAVVALAALLMPVGAIGGANHAPDHHDLAVVGQRMEAREQDSRRQGDGWGQGVDRHGMLRAVGCCIGRTNRQRRRTATTPSGYGTKSPRRRDARLILNLVRGWYQRCRT